MKNVLLFTVIHPSCIIVVYRLCSYPQLWGGGGGGGGQALSIGHCDNEFDQKGLVLFAECPPLIFAPLAPAQAYLGGVCSARSRHLPPSPLGSSGSIFHHSPAQWASHPTSPALSPASTPSLDSWRDPLSHGVLLNPACINTQEFNVS